MEHIRSIDFLKGLAILGVITMHSSQYHTYPKVIEILLLQSVPIFLILMGTVGAMSLNAKGFDWRTYFPKRIRRLVVPLIPIFFVTIFIGYTYGKQIYIGWANLIGEMPVAGPGQYFITLAISGIIIIPALWFVAREISMAFMLATCFFVSLNLELFPELGFFPMIFRNLFFFAIGIYLATVITRNEMPKWLLVAICLSIVLVGIFAWYPVFDIETLYGNCLTSFFTVGIIITVLSLDWSYTPIDYLGVASWHIFLTQMIVLAFINYGLWVNLLLILPIGIGFYYLDSGKIPFFQKSVEHQ